METYSASKTSLAGLPSGARMWVRVRALGPKKNQKSSGATRRSSGCREAAIPASVAEVGLALL